MFSIILWWAFSLGSVSALPASVDMDTTSRASASPDMFTVSRAGGARTGTKLPGMGAGTKLPGMGAGGSEKGSGSASDDAGGCSQYHFVFARGTGEAQGFGVVGAPLGAGLSANLKSVSKYSVVYAAGPMQMSMPGSVTAVSHINDYLKKCPNSKIIISGYSQGAALVHDMKPGAYTKNVCAIVLFGDPRKPGGIGRTMGNGDKFPIDNKDAIFNACNAMDNVCGPKNTLGTGTSHLGYATGVTQAAIKFATSKCGR